MLGGVQPSQNLFPVGPSSPITLQPRGWHLHPPQKEQPGGFGLTAGIYWAHSRERQRSPLSPSIPPPPLLAEELWLLGRTKFTCKKAGVQTAEGEVGHRLVTPIPFPVTAAGFRRSTATPRRPKPSAPLGLLVLPEGDLAIVAAGGEQPRLLRVPGHAVDVLRVRPWHVGCEAEGGLLLLLGGGRRALLEDTDGVVTAGRGQRSGEAAPGGGGRRETSPKGPSREPGGVPAAARSPRHVVDGPGVVP